MRYITKYTMLLMLLFVSMTAFSATPNSEEPDPTIPVKQADGSWTFKMPGEHRKVNIELFPPVLTIATNNSEWGQVKLVNGAESNDPVNNANVTDNGDGTYTVATGTEVYVKAIASKGYYIKNWSNEANITNNLETIQTITINDDMTITANFAAYPILTIASNDETMGTVAINGKKLPAGVTLIGTGTYSVRPGTELTVSASATQDNHFVNWTNANSEAYTTGIVTPEGNFPATSQITFTLNDEMTVQANFDANGIFVEVPAGEFVSYYGSRTLILNEEETDAKVYTVSSVTDSEVVLSEIDGVIPAQTPMLVYNGGNATKEVLLNYSQLTGSSVLTAPEFKGTLVAKSMPASSATNYYILNGTAFVYVKKAGTISANKCWLEVVENEPQNARQIVFGGDVTGISITNHEPLTINYLYDLNGRKVSKATKGVYIQNGKKIIIK